MANLRLTGRDIISGIQRELQAGDTIAGLGEISPFLYFVGPNYNYPTIADALNAAYATLPPGSGVSIILEPQQTHTWSGTVASTHHIYIGSFSGFERFNGEPGTVIELGNINFESPDPILNQIGSSPPFAFYDANWKQVVIENVAVKSQSNTIIRIAAGRQLFFRDALLLSTNFDLDMLDVPALGTFDAVSFLAQIIIFGCTSNGGSNFKIYNPPSGGFWFAAPIRIEVINSDLVMSSGLRLGLASVDMGIPTQFLFQNSYGYFAANNDSALTPQPIFRNTGSLGSAQTRLQFYHSAIEFAALNSAAIVEFIEATHSVRCDLLDTPIKQSGSPTNWEIGPIGSTRDDFGVWDFVKVSKLPVDIAFEEGSRLRNPASPYKDLYWNGAAWA